MVFYNGFNLLVDILLVIATVAITVAVMKGRK
jgi:hypothetical protein